MTEPFEDGSFDSSETDRLETTVEEVVEESTHPATIELEVTETTEDPLEDSSLDSTETEHPEATTEEVAISSSIGSTTFTFETEPVDTTTDLFQTTKFYYSPEEEMDDSITTTDLPQPNTSLEPEPQNGTARPLSGCYDDYEK